MLVRRPPTSFVISPQAAELLLSTRSHRYFVLNRDEHEAEMNLARVEKSARRSLKCWRRQRRTGKPSTKKLRFGCNVITRPRLILL